MTMNEFDLRSLLVTMCFYGRNVLSNDVVNVTLLAGPSQEVEIIRTLIQIKGLVWIDWAGCGHEWWELTDVGVDWVLNNLDG